MEIKCFPWSADHVNLIRLMYTLLSVMTIYEWVCEETTRTLGATHITHTRARLIRVFRNYH